IVRPIGLGSAKAPSSRDTLTIAVVSRKAPVMPPWMAGRIGLPMIFGENGMTSVPSSLTRMPRQRAKGLLANGLAGSSGASSVGDARKSIGRSVSMLVRFAPTMKHAGFRVADEDRTVRQARPGLAGGGAVEPKSADQSIDGTAPLDGLGQFVKRQRRVGYRGFGHGDVLDQ